MERRHAAARRIVRCGLAIFFVLSALVLLRPHAALAITTAPGTAASTDAAQARLSAVVKVKVICARVRKGSNTITYSCPNGNTCVNVAGAWKCRPPRVVGQCNVCYSNYNRDSKNCGPGDARCVNSRLGELKRCLAHCN
jgi:hypothetical protein